MIFFQPAARAIKTGDSKKYNVMGGSNNDVQQQLVNSARSDGWVVWFVVWLSAKSFFSLLVQTSARTFSI